MVRAGTEKGKDRWGVGECLFVSLNGVFPSKVTVGPADPLEPRTQAVDQEHTGRVALRVLRGSLPLCQGP